ncbi:hypothetical protein J1N35_007330 [Gossypium stocksii]|uniref:Uncharacterized protein n=1 Tax=Gossypium stocksii TaxID=47602 RepID=A0A9D4ADD5_9ROSI|nr:hypothetical protein J1N35_007330 [Gossypium stocksii]
MLFMLECKGEVAGKKSIKKVPFKPRAYLSRAPVDTKGKKIWQITSWKDEASRQ